nr:MAG TPA: hypothetical protein [Caudoviricetes sp.]
MRQSSLETPFRGPYVLVPAVIIVRCWRFVSGNIW